MYVFIYTLVCVPFYNIVTTIIIILQDKSQVLFQECGVQKKDHICKEPIVPIPNVTCIYHLSLLSDPVSIVNSIKVTNYCKISKISQANFLPLSCTAVLVNFQDTNNQLSETDESSSADQKVPDIETDSKVKIQGDAFEMLLNYSQKQEMSSNFTSTPS